MRQAAKPFPKRSKLTGVDKKSRNERASLTSREIKRRKRMYSTTRASRCNNPDTVFDFEDQRPTSHICLLLHSTMDQHGMAWFYFASNYNELCVIVALSHTRPPFCIQKLLSLFQFFSFRPRFSLIRRSSKTSSLPHFPRNVVYFPCKFPWSTCLGQLFQCLSAL